MKYKKVIVKIFCALLAVVITAATIWDFSLQLQHELTKEIYRTLSDVSIDYNKSFLDRISYNIKTMNVLAGGLVEMNEPSKQDIMDILQNAVDDGDFERVVVATADGMTCANDGLSINISEREYFKRAMRGETNISDPLTSVVNGKESIIIAVPIQNDSETIGVLFGVYPLDTAGAQLLNFTYYSEGYGFVVSPDGKIILASQHMDRLADGKNLFSFFEKTDFADYSINELKATVEKGGSGSFTFTYKGERRFVSFIPSDINGWYTFSIASDTLMLQQEKATNRIVLELVASLAVVGLLLLAWIIAGNRRHNKELLLANQKYQSLLSHINGGMIVADHALAAEETIATYVSSGFTDMTGYTLEDIQNTYQGRYLDVILDEDRKPVFDIYLEQLKVGKTYRMPYRIRKKDGSLIWVMDNGYLVEDETGLHNHSIITDISVIKQQEEELRMSENRFSVAINASSGALFEVDLKRQIYTHFENAERIFGISSEKLLEDTRAFSGLPFDEFVEGVTKYFFHPDDRAAANMSMELLVKNKTASYEARMRRLDGSYIWCRIDLSLNLDEFGEPTRLIGFMSDINDIKKQAEILESKVQTDPMTGLYNKIAMATLADKILTDNPNGRHALIVIDIDDFKGINDTLGHVFGDLVLIEMGTKLKNLFRNNDIVGRMGGDEFAILMKSVSDSSSVLKKAAELAGAFRQTYTGEKGDYRISCSIGIIMIDGGCEKFEALYRKADAALYQAKQNGKDRFILYRDDASDSYPIGCGRTNDEELRKLQSAHSMESQIFELLYTSRDFGVSINMALAAIGQEYRVSRVSIFENDYENLTTSNIYEWCSEGIASKIDTLQNLSIAAGRDSVMDSFDEDGLLYCNDVRELPNYLRHVLESKGVLSTLKVTITNDDRICGFIGFDECTDYRIWTSEEIEKLTFLAKVLGVFLFKEKTKATVLANLKTRLEILDVLPDYISVVNPLTHALVYANKKMRELLPDAQPGAFCFSTLRGGQSEPCETCLIERIKRGDTDNLEIVSEDGKLHLQVDALAINWSNEQEMVLLYGTEKAPSD
ncbi:MAG: diguanylate cyclase [Oscillospiraceae bacterium]